MDPKQEASLRVQSYLRKHKARLQHMTVDFIFSDVRNFGPDSKDLLDSELTATIAVWLSLNRAPYTLPVTPSPTLPDSKLIDAVKKGVTTVIDGVDIVRRDDGSLNVSIKGLTANLGKGTSANVSWGGTLSVETRKGDFHSRRRAFVAEMVGDAQLAAGHLCSGPQQARKGVRRGRDGDAQHRRRDRKLPRPAGRRARESGDRAARGRSHRGGQSGRRRRQEAGEERQLRPHASAAPPRCRARPACRAASRVGRR